MAKLLTEELCRKAQASITTSVLGKRSDVAIKRRLRRLEKCNYPYMRSFVIIFILFLASSLKAQTFVKADNDTTVMSEYNDGRIWALRRTWYSYLILLECTY